MSGLGHGAKSLTTQLAFWETKLKAATTIAVKMAHFKTEQRPLGIDKVILSSNSQRFHS